MTNQQRFDRNRLLQVLEEDEGEPLEFKEGLLSRKEIGEYAVGIGNEGGGWLILGVSNRKPRRIVGITPLSTEALQRIRDGVIEAIGIRIDPVPLALEEGFVLAVQIPSRPRGQVFSTNTGKFLMRSGESLRGMTLTEIERIRAEDLRHQDFSAEVVSQAWQEVIDPLEVQRLRRVLLENNREEFARLGDEDLVRSLELLAPSSKRTGVTRAAILLLGTPEAIREFIPAHEIKLQRFDRDDLTPAFVEDIRAPLLAVIQRAREVIEVANSVESFQSGFFRVDIPKFPNDAYREAIANALAHRDYLVNGNISIRVYRNRLEVGSPGGWFGGVNECNILVSESQRRNELLASVLQRIGLTERSALGVKRMFRSLLRAGKEPPEYRATLTSITVVLQDGSFDREFATLVFHCIDQGVELSVFDLLILSYLRRHREITVPAAATVCQQSQAAALRIMDDLRNARLLDRRGSGWDRSYVLGVVAYQHLNLVAERPRDLGISEKTFEGLLIDELERRKGDGITSREIRMWSHHGKAQTTRLLQVFCHKGTIVSSGKRGTGARYWPPQYAPVQLGPHLSVGQPD